MSELKTLKVLGTPRLFGLDDPKRKEKLNERIIVDTELKAEAVKWVKDLEMSHQFREDGLNMDYCKGMLEWIKHFFNLTEEDLKNE